MTVTEKYNYSTMLSIYIQLLKQGLVVIQMYKVYFCTDRWQKQCIYSLMACNGSRYISKIISRHKNSLNMPLYRADVTTHFFCQTWNEILVDSQKLTGTSIRCIKLEPKCAILLLINVLNYELVTNPNYTQKIPFITVSRICNNLSPSNQNASDKYRFRGNVSGRLGKQL